MISLVKDRKVDFSYSKELYKDFNINGLYSYQTVERWLDCEVFSNISYWMERKCNWINYSALSKQQDEIIAAASRINNKYASSEVNDKLIGELADDISSHYLSELYSNLIILKEGISKLNLLVTILISLSLIFGVLTPFLFLTIFSSENFFFLATKLIVSVNVGLIVYFIVKFPFLINNELKWI